MKQTKEMKYFNHILKGSLFISALSISMTSCDMFKKAETTTVPKKDTPKEKTETPTKGKTVLVDTIQWKIDSKAKPPIMTGTNPPSSPYGSTDNNGQTTTPSPTPTNDTKSSYTVTMLLPFNSDKYTEGVIPPKAQFALDFYAGAKIALDSLATLPVNLTINVLDSRGDFNKVSSRYEVTKSDVIIGPVDKDGVVSAIAYADRNNTTVVSPYFPTGDIEGSNPNFVQVKPSLKTHCLNIVKHLESHYSNAQVVLAARVKDNEVSRFAYFEEANRMYSSAKYEEWRIEDDFAFNVEPYIANGRTTVFVVPSWNEQFVTSFLKKLNNSPRRNQIVVYGMPQWMDFDKSLNPLYENLKVRISSSTFIDSGNPEVKNFKNKFLAKYGKLPHSDAFLGYDCMLYTGKMVFQYGAKFPLFIDREQQPVLHTRFNFVPIFRATTTGNDTNDSVSKYENSYVNILRFQASAFRLDE